MTNKTMNQFWILPAGCALAFSASAIAAEKHIFEAETAGLFGGASKVADSAGSKGCLVGLTRPGEGGRFAGLPPAGKLAIRYASVSAGTISVAVDDQPARKVNVHPSGALTNSFLHSIIEMAIPVSAAVTISLAASDVAVNGWVRRCNLGTGDFNNDLTTSDTPGDVWSSSFTGSSVSGIAPIEAGAGKIEVQIDGQSRATADLSTTGARQAQQAVCEVTGLVPGNHATSIVNRSPGPVAVDALLVR